MQWGKENSREAQRSQTTATYLRFFTSRQQPFEQRRETFICWSLSKSGIRVQISLCRPTLLQVLYKEGAGTPSQLAWVQHMNTIEL